MISDVLIALLAQPAHPHSGAVGLLNRIGAKAIDLGIFVALSVALPWPLGPLAGFCYSIFGDAFAFGPFRGQSIGKRAMKLAVRSAIRRDSSGAPAMITYKESALRNSPVGVTTFFGIIPLWGWVILALVGVPLLVLEVYLMATKPQGQRLGDVMGETVLIPLE